MARRIGIGGIWHESNSLVPVTTRLADFASYQSAAGADLVDAFADTRTEVGGALAGCARHGFTVVPLAFRAARPSGAVSGEALRFLLDDLHDRIEAAAPLDAVVLCLHGAMVAEDDACPDLTVAGAVRRSNQGGLLAVTLDFHANLGESLVELADVCVGYRTYPHIDCFETGVEAVDALARIWAAGGTVPPSAFAKLPLLTAPHEQETDDGAMAKVMQIVEALRAEPGVDTLNIFPGYPYARSPELGLAVCGSGRSVGLAVSRVADQIWSMRSELAVPLASVEQAAVHCAGTCDGARVVLADIGDNVGGGSAGDGTELLQALENRGQRGVLAVLWAPEAVDQIYCESGELARVDLGRPDGGRDTVGPPMAITGSVCRPGVVEYRRSGSYMSGQRVSLGRVAIVEASIGTVILTEQRALPFDADHVLATGVNLHGHRVIIVKSAVAWRAGFSDWATEALLVDTPGACPGHLARIPGSAIGRLYPLNLEAEKP